MKNLNFKYAAAWNFLPFGPQGIELHFNKYKNIVLIKGENKDSKPLDSDNSEQMYSNASGKSSMQDVLTWGLYGRTVKRPEKISVDDVVHNKIKKDCKVEIIFDKYRIIRTRKKNSLRLWESEKGEWNDKTELTEGSMATTQKKIEDILGLSYDAFINISIFTDDQRSCFLECDKNKKREIVENMLSLSIYREWFDNAKELKKEIRAKIEIKTKEFEILTGNLKDANRRLLLTKQKDEQWKNDKKNEELILIKKIENKKKELDVTDNGNELKLYLEAQEKIKNINENMPSLDKEKEELNGKLKLAQDKENSLKEEAQELNRQYGECSFNTKNLLSQRKEIENEISSLESNEIGARCNVCYEIIKEENIHKHTEIKNEKKNELNIKIKDFVDKSKEIAVKSEELKVKQNKIKSYINQFSSNISTIEEKLKNMRSELLKASQIREPKVDNEELLIQEQLQVLNSQLEDKRKELSLPSPFMDILENDKKEVDKIEGHVVGKEKEVKELESDLPYYDYWISGFGETGIRKWIIDGIIPELNSRIDYWLQFLMDNKISLKFDNELTEIIERSPSDGDPFIYHAMSTGQRRRLNLAVSQSFAHIMSLSSGSIPSVIFLDEVSTNIDQSGIIGIYNMICELAEDKQVFITTHDQELSKLLQGCETINLVHEDGFTKMS